MGVGKGALLPSSELSEMPSALHMTPKWQNVTISTCSLNLSLLLYKQTPGFQARAGARFSSFRKRDSHQGGMDFWVSRWKLESLEVNAVCVVRKSVFSIRMQFFCFERQ